MRLIPVQPLPPFGKRGSATILMVFMVAVILTVGLGFNWLVKEHLQASESLKNKAEAIVMARSAYDTLIYLLLIGKVMPQEVTLTGAEEMTSLNAFPLNNTSVQLTDDVSVRIQDSNGLLSLTTVNSEALQRLIKQTMQVDNAAIPVVGLQDWIDQDDLTRVNGAEASYYRNKGMTCLPRNYALQFGEEFGFVRGMSTEAYARLQPDLTLLPSNGFNPNTATDGVMMAYLNIDEKTLMRIKEYREKSGVVTANALYALTGRKIAKDTSTTSFTPSLFMDIIVNAGQPKSMYSIKAGLSLKQNNFAPYSVLYWREE